MAMLDIIKRAGLGAVEASNPMAVMFGTVTKTNPLEVNVDQRFTLTEDFLIVPESLQEYKVSAKGKFLTDHKPDDEIEEWDGKVLVSGDEITIRRGLNVGDKVLLLRVQGGQKFVILDKVVG